MNSCLLTLFENERSISKLARGLPLAFEMAGIELPSGNPAVGVLREHAIVGYFQDCLGIDKVKVPKSGVKRGYDVEICGKALSIKTVTGNGEIKVVWTSDNQKVDEEILSYKVDSDMFLVRIFWDEDVPSVFYIPQETQAEVINNIGRQKYLASRRATNNRGIIISNPAIKELQKHSKTKIISINWKKSGLSYTPYDRWIDFWKEKEEQTSP